MSQQPCPFCPEAIEEIRKDVHEIKSHIVGDLSNPGLDERVRNIERLAAWFKGGLAAVFASAMAWLWDRLS